MLRNEMRNECIRKKLEIVLIEDKMNALIEMVRPCAMQIIFTGSI